MLFKTAQEGLLDYLIDETNEFLQDLYKNDNLKSVENA